MDRNTITGMLLIFLLLMGYQWLTAPSPEEIEAAQRAQDSLAQVDQQLEEDINTELTAPAPVQQDDPQYIRLDSSRLVQEYGAFAQAARGEASTVSLSNDVIDITFSNKGGHIISANLKHHQKVSENNKKEEVKSPLLLLNDEKNIFSYSLPVTNTSNGFVRTRDLYFTPTQSGNTVTFRAEIGPGQYFEQEYTLVEGYQLNYVVRMVGLQNVLANAASSIQLDWVNYLDKLEKNYKFERRYSTVYYKPDDDTPDYCNCMKDDTDDRSDEAIKWVSNSNQFFNTTLIADERFSGAILNTEMLDEEDEDLKKLTSTITMPYGHSPNETISMRMYIGPNEFERLAQYELGLEQIIPFGRSIFGTFNRWVIRPLFSFLSKFIGSKGLAILVLTILVKLAVYPLMYRMLYSQSKMAALKPEIEKLKGKFKDKPQEQQQATMKLYSEYGVNPLGGCFPMLLQMPIWIALYRFFPASIQFRQEPFLWATDLSSYDVLFNLPFEIPLGFGSHVSLFTLLWAITTLIYTYYNTKHMDMSANPAMKYMQYIMPIFFMGFFNSYASGLTCYLLFSNLTNITQTIVTKEFIIDKEKINAELARNKAKPRKKGGFRDRLEAALAEQQKLQEERSRKKDKGKK